MNGTQRFHVLLTATIIGMAAKSVRAQPHAWKAGFEAETGIPSGFVQVRENRIGGTPLPLRSALGVSHVISLRVSVFRRVGRRSRLHLWLSGTQLTGSRSLAHTAYFNGTKLDPGPISSDTHFLDDWRLSAAYWYRIVGSGHGNGLWLSGGVTYVGLNFKIGARIASGSVGHETKEDFITQELPIPIFGIHLHYSLHRDLSLFGDLDDGHLPWTNSLRREGGMIQLTQTDEDSDLGLRYRFDHTWSARLYLYDRHFIQNERSGEDGNFIRLDQHGIGIGFAGRF